MALVAQLKSFETLFGGKKTAYDVEKKVEIFILLILQHAFKGTGLKIEAEVCYKVFDDMVKPDLQVISSRDNEASLYIIEVKKMFNRNDEREVFYSLSSGIP